MLPKNVYELHTHFSYYKGLNARKCVGRVKCSKMCMGAEMLKNVYEGLNAQNCV